MLVRKQGVRGRCLLALAMGQVCRGRRGQISHDHSTDVYHYQERNGKSLGCFKRDGAKNQYVYLKVYSFPLFTMENKLEGRK